MAGEWPKMAACSVTWAEFLCGPLRAEQMKIASTTIRTQILFLTEHCALAAELFNATGRRRGSLADCMIAAVAIKSQAPLATSNLADFRKFARHGLVLAQW